MGNLFFNIISSNWMLDQNLWYANFTNFRFFMKIKTLPINLDYFIYGKYMENIIPCKNSKGFNLKIYILYTIIEIRFKLIHLYYYRTKYS